jgi:hypothetical protein
MFYSISRSISKLFHAGNFRLPMQHVGLAMTGRRTCSCYLWPRSSRAPSSCFWIQIVREIEAVLSVSVAIFSGPPNPCLLLHPRCCRYRMRYPARVHTPFRSHLRDYKVSLLERLPRAVCSISFQCRVGSTEERAGSGLVPTYSRTELWAQSVVCFSSTKMRVFWYGSEQIAPVPGRMC